jgi:hypothetical protein
VTVETPDLSAARDAVTALMIDGFRVVRDSQGSGDDSFDYATGVYGMPVGDSGTVYLGKGKISQAGTQGAGVTRGDLTTEATDYVFSVPLDGGYEPRIGDVVVCTESVRDPNLVGKLWRVTDPLYSTFAVSRKATCELLLTPDGPQ